MKRIVLSRNAVTSKQKDGNMGKFDHIVEHITRSQRPRLGNICNVRGCGGDVVQKQTGWVRNTNKKVFDEPRCIRCEQLHLNATNVRKIFLEKKRGER